MGRNRSPQTYSDNTSGSGYIRDSCERTRSRKIGKTQLSDWNCGVNAWLRR